MNEISTKYFGKELELLEYSDIENYFVESKIESDRIEFKSYHSKHGLFNKNLEGIIRSITAFLNSEGGLIIWGAPQKQKIGDKEIFQGKLSPLEEFKDKDSLISKISDSITPLPIGINIEIVEKDKTYLYIFEIKKSIYSPHQFQNKYFCRLDGQTKPAPHYLIEALFKKISFPNLEGYINLDKFGSLDNELSYLNISILLFNFSEFQNEHNAVFRLYCPEAVFQDSIENPFENSYDENGHLFHSHNITTLHYGLPEEVKETLIFKWDDIQGFHKNEINLFLYFGGKQSPMKLSEYKLSLDGSISSSNPSHIIKEKNENILMADVHSNLNSGREKILSKVLKR